VGQSCIACDTSDCDSADGVKIRTDPPVTQVPEVPHAAPPAAAGQPPFWNEQPAQAVVHQPMAPAIRRPVRSKRDAHPRYASAAVGNPVHLGEGNRKRKHNRKRNRKGNCKGIRIVTFVAPLEMPWGADPQQPGRSEFNSLFEQTATWRLDVK
jgi:hypothetical protein